jgi:hypothetical protein
MTKRAIFTKADLSRAVEVAQAKGLQVVIEGGVIRLLPITPEGVHIAEPPKAGETSADTDWDKALGI